MSALNVAKLVVVEYIASDASVTCGQKVVLSVCVHVCVGGQRGAQNACYGKCFFKLPLCFTSF